MVINCSLCGHRVESLIIDRMLALKEITDSLMKHCDLKHRTQFRLLQTNIQQGQIAFAWFCSMQALAFVPSEQEFITGEIEKQQGLLMTLMGYDEAPEEEEEEEEGEETSETNVNSEEKMGEKVVTMEEKS